MFSFIQGLSVPLFDSKETNNIIEDNSFFKSFLTVILRIDLILVWLPMWFQERCSNSKCHIQTCPQSKRKKSSIVLDKTLPQETLASFLIKENCVTGMLLNQSLAGQVKNIIIDSS